MRVFRASSTGWMDIGGQVVRCAIGKAGAKPADQKREGDGASPLGTWPIRRVMWRKDKRLAPETTFALSPIQPDDGWCDAAGDPNYNHPVTHPYPASAERMWRDDDLYDIVVILGHNDAPMVDAMGSAIFLHVAQPNYAGTAGCVALRVEDLEAFLLEAKPGDCIEIGHEAVAQKST
jgi:L,D-peptidoglycan transpeptidase YkuD (ErfK/YbiS/YcfS/YnhG family)